MPADEVSPDVHPGRIKLAFYPECHHEVTRDGRAEPCEDPAVAMRLDFNWSSTGDPYPVCARHVSKRKGQMVWLTQLMREAN